MQPTTRSVIDRLLITFVAGLTICALYEQHKLINEFNTQAKDWNERISYQDNEIKQLKNSVTVIQTNKLIRDVDRLYSWADEVDSDLDLCLIFTQLQSPPIHDQSQRWPLQQPFIPLR